MTDDLRARLTTLTEGWEATRNRLRARARADSNWSGDKMDRREANTWDVAAEQLRALLAPAPASETARGCEDCGEHKHCDGSGPDCWDPATTPPKGWGRQPWEQGTVSGPFAAPTPPTTVQADLSHRSYYSSPGDHAGTREDCHICPPMTAAQVQADRDAGQVRLTGELAEIREALRHEIGPPTDRDRKWQPMVSAHEVRVLLDELDRLAARQSDPDATERVETVEWGVQFDGDFVAGMFGSEQDARAYLKHQGVAVVRRTVTTGEWTEVGDRG